MIPMMAHYYLAIWRTPIHHWWPLDTLHWKKGVTFISRCRNRTWVVQLREHLSLLMNLRFILQCLADGEAQAKTILRLFLNVVHSTMSRNVSEKKGDWTWTQALMSQHCFQDSVTLHCKHRLQLHIFSLVTPVFKATELLTAA